MDGPMQLPLRPTARCRSSPWVALLAAVVVSSCGCQLYGRANPVPEELLSCRQLSQRAIGAMDRGEWTKAETLLAEAIQACPVDTEARKLYAEALWQRGAVQDAIEQYTEAVQ